MTNKLYLQDAYIQEFQAVVLESRQAAGNWEIILDQTAFYPEGGGQPFDTGEIGGLPVTAVREEGETVIHVMPQPPASATLTGRIDWYKRFDHMQQHSGQHILSAVFDNKWQAATVGFHLGADLTQIDLAISNITPEQIAEAEITANLALYANIPVTAAWVKQKDIGRYRLRKPPTKEFAQLRLVSAGDIDCCPCGGTHVKAAGEIGMIKILGWERKNNAVRVSFVCGRRALADYQLKQQLIQEITESLSAPAKEVSEAFAQRMAKLDTLTKELAAARSELSQCQANALLQAALLYKEVHIVSHCLQNAQPNDAAHLAKHLIATVPAAAFVAAISPGSAKAHLVFATNTDRMDMGKMLKAALAKLDGKGGGTPRLAQGGTGDPDKLHEVLEETLAAAKRALEN